MLTVWPAIKNITTKINEYLFGIVPSGAIIHGRTTLTSLTFPYYEIENATPSLPSKWANKPKLKPVLCITIDNLCIRYHWIHRMFYVTVTDGVMGNTSQLDFDAVQMAYQEAHDIQGTAHTLPFTNQRPPLSEEFTDTSNTGMLGQNLKQSMSSLWPIILP